MSLLDFTKIHMRKTNKSSLCKLLREFVKFIPGDGKRNPFSYVMFTFLFETAVNNCVILIDKDEIAFIFQRSFMLFKFDYFLSQERTSPVYMYTFFPS